MAIDYVVAKEDYDEYMEIIKNQKQEIERLNKARKTDIEYNKYLQKEIIRLNNIINKIRNWLEEDYKRTINNEVCDYPRYYLDKFDEIVGSESNE